MLETIREQNREIKLWEQVGADDSRAMAALGRAVVARVLTGPGCVCGGAVGHQVGGMLLSSKTITKIWEKAVWDEDLEEWRLPRFKARSASSALVGGGGSSGKSAQEKVKLPTIGMNGTPVAGRRAGRQGG